MATEGNDDEDYLSEISRDPVSAALIDLLEDTGIGGKLPNERQLADSLGVSRTMLRDRLTLLESLGAVERRIGSGTFVQPLDPRRLGEALDIGLRLADHTTASLQSVRVALERQAAKEAAGRVDRLNAAHLQIALDGIRAGASSAAVEQADFDFHAALVRASGNTSMVFFTEALRVPLRRLFSERRPYVERIPDHQGFMIELHQAILDAVLAQDASGAVAAVDRHFDRFDEAVELLRG